MTLISRKVYGNFGDDMSETSEPNIPQESISITSAFSLCGKCQKPKAGEGDDATNIKFCQCGRPLFDGKEETMVLSKLEQAALIDATIEEMCYYAEISVSAYYRYLDNHPEFRERIEQLRERLPLKSRQNIAARIEGGDVPLSKWMLERKKPIEFGETLKLKHSGKIEGSEVHPEDEELRLMLKEGIKKNIHKRWEEKEKPEIKDENENPQ